MLPVGKDTILSVDFETTGIEWYKDKVFGVAVAAYTDGKIHSEYVDIRKNQKYVAQIQDYINSAGKIVNHNIKFDLLFGRNDLKLKFPLEKCHCTMVNACLIDENRLSYSLDACAFDALGEHKEDIYAELADMFGGKPTRQVQMPNLQKAPESLARKYAIKDPELAIKLFLWQEEECKRQGLEQIFVFEQRCLGYLTRLEEGGICVDEESAHEAIKKLDIVIRANHYKLNKMAGFEVNYNPSSRDIPKMFNAVERDGEFFVGNFKVPKTPGGKPSFNKDALELLPDERANTVLTLRKLTRTRDTFLKGHILGHMYNGRVYPSINQTKGETEYGEAGTGTGRLSYTEPALQQIPARDKAIAEIVRPIFRPDPGQKWSYGDLDQHEFRVFAHYTKSKALLDRYTEDPDLDIHMAVAELTGLPRNASRSGGPNAKQLNLAMVFNMGGASIAKKMGMATEIVEKRNSKGKVIRSYEIAGPEAREIIEKYHNMVPGVRELAQKAASIAESRGHVRTIKGRHIRFPHRGMSYKASGLLFQGSSADLNKENIMLAMDVLEGSNSRLLMNIHDEYSCSIAPGNEHLLQEIKNQIQHKPELRVPIRVDFSQPCDNWWLATKADKYTK